MFSTALGELNAPSLDYVFYKMTWAEYQLRLYSFNRQKEREDRNFREVAWSALWSFNADPKKLPKTKQQFWKIGEEIKQDRDLAERRKVAIQKAKEQFIKESNERKVKG